MPVTTIPKHQVARELLERAIELFLREDSYYAAIHLGGAAEELLAVYAREVQITSTAKMKPTVDQVKEAIVAFSKPASIKEKEAAEKWAHDSLMDAKNSVKHKRGASDNVVVCDEKEEARDVIDRAISTYMQLQVHLGMHPLSCLAQFDAARH